MADTGSNTKYSYRFIHPFFLLFLPDRYIHMADWYSTFCGLAGVDPTDTVAAKHGLPPIDSTDMWPYLSGAVAASPRTEIALCVDFAIKAPKNTSLPIPKNVSLKSLNLGGEGAILSIL